MGRHVAVKIRLKRMGKIRAPYYRVVVADARTKRDGRAIEEIGKYHPTEEPSLIDIDSDRVQYWLGVGAQPTEQVVALLKVTGDWQRFRGLPGAEGTLRTAAARPDRQARYEAAMRDIQGEPAAEAAVPRGRRPKTAATAAPDTAVPPGARPAVVEPAAAPDAASVAEVAVPAPGSAGASDEARAAETGSAGSPSDDASATGASVTA
jgi:small subunit ribosomal protein S16